MDDINFGLQYPNASFDIVTSRFIAGGITNWRTTIREMYRVLAGTGTSWVQITELRPSLCCDDDSIPADAACMTWSNLFFAPGTIGNDLGTANFDEIVLGMKSYIEAAGFIDIHEYIDKAPVGSWHPSNPPLL